MGELREVPALRIQLPSYRYGVLVGWVQLADVEKVGETLVRFRSDWSTQDGMIIIPVTVVETGGCYRVRVDRLYIEEYDLVR